MEYFLRAPEIALVREYEPSALRLFNRANAVHPFRSLFARLCHRDG